MMDIQLEARLVAVEAERDALQTMVKALKEKWCATEARLAAVEAERDAARAECERLRVACKALMQWMGPPPADRYSYDSVREDAWNMARAALDAPGEEMTE
jgi:septal ring factor EnvC (AmiA/AmiB activator)